MNIFYSILNKIRFSKVTSIDNENIFAVGTNKNEKNGYALLQNGKIIANNLMWISSNLLSKNENAQTDFILTKPVGDKYLIYNKKGKCLTPDGLKIFRSKYEVPEDYPMLYGIDDEYGDILVESKYDYNKFLIYPHTKNMSSTFVEIGEYDDNAQRKVKELGYISYYIDRKGKRCTLPFVSESEIDKNQNHIQVIVNTKGLDVQVLVDKNHKWISHLYDSLQPFGEGYIGFLRKDNSIHKLDSKGQEIGSITHKEYKSKTIQSLKEPKQYQESSESTSTDERV